MAIVHTFFSHRQLLASLYQCGWFGNSFRMDDYTTGVEGIRIYNQSNIY